MHTRTLVTHAVLLASLLFGGCSAGPTEKEIIDSLDQALQSVNGPWVGVNPPENLLALSFTLTQSASGAVTGSGTMKETSAAANVPITITGSYQRPVLQLNFSGMVFEGRAVSGTFQGNYTTVGGISAGLRMTASGYDRTLNMLLQER